jgi:Holliday junction resolvase RusA-like endonuclease
MITFHLPITPPKATSQTKRLVMVGGKPRFFAKKEHQSAENDLTLLCSRFAPAEPLTGPLMLRVDFVFPWRKSETKRRMALGSVPNDSRPDCDNLVKLIADVLTKLRFYNDDGQVADLHVTKAWGDQVGISVTIQPYANPMQTLCDPLHRQCEPMQTL